MFDLKAISTADVIAFLQLLAICAGFYYSRRSIDVAAASLATASNSAQAQLLQQILTEGRQLQFKFVELYADADTEKAKAQKRDQFLGTLIGYYAGCFELRRVLKIQGAYETLMDEELRALIAQTPFRAKWDSLKKNFNNDFVQHVERNIGVRT